MRSLRYVVPALLLLISNCSFGQAPTISYVTPQKYLINTPLSLSPSSNGVAARGYSSSPVLLGSGFSSPTGVHVDAAGNIYVSSFYETTAKTIPVGSNTPVAIGSGFVQPFDITTDAAGNIYVADLGNNAVKEIPAGSTTPIAFGSGFMQPAGVAVDAAGNVYIADYGHNLVKEIKPGGSPVSIGSGFSTPTGVAVDAFGNVYVSDYGNNAIKKISAGSNTPVAIGSGFSLPNGVAVDATGNVFVADFGSKTVKEILAGTNTTITLNTGAVNPYKVTIDASGHLLIADFSNASILKSVPTGGYYIDKPLPAGLTFNNATGVISGTPTVTSPATTYTITAYNTHGGTAAYVNIQVKLPTAPTISYSTPKTYLVNTAVALSPSSSGVAPAAYGSNPLLLGSGFNSPTGVAVDAAGNIFVSNFYESTLKKIPAGGGAPVLVGSGFTQAFDVAIDAAGNLYIADLGNNLVKKIPAGSNTPVAIGTGFSQPAGVAIDAAGNVYVADYGHNAVKKIQASNGNTVSIGSGFATPTGVAVDAYGNIYVADYGNNAIKKIPAGSNTPVTIGTGISLPNGLCVDASGNVFEADYGTSTVKEILAGTNTTITLNTGAVNPYKVTIDGAGNLIVADFSSPSVKKIVPTGGFYINKSLPAGLTFSNSTGTISGTPIVSSPATIYTVTAYNTGGGTAANVSLQINLPPVPVISYNNPQAYLINSDVSLSPSSNYVSPPGYSSKPVLLGSGFSSPTGVAVNAAGDIYVSSFYESTLKKIPAGGGAPVLVGSGFTEPFDVALDAAGNIYIADLGNNAVKKIPVGSNTPVTIGSGFAEPAGVAVDASGNVYVADYGNNAVKIIPVGTTTPISIGSGFATPTGVAVDAYGNVYVADYGNNAIKKIPAGSNTPVIIGTGISLPNGVCVDASGNVFEADYGTNTVKEILAGTNTTITLNSGAINPYKVTTDGFGNVIVADFSSPSVDKVVPTGGFYISKALPAGLIFNNTTGNISGKPTAASPATIYKVSGYNTGGKTTANVNIQVNATSSTDALLKSLTINGTLSPAFVRNIYNYTSAVANSVASLILTPTVNTPGAYVTVNGTAVASGAPTAGVPLNVGSNIIKVIVTAQDNVTQKIYTITVTRVSLLSANLAGLKMSTGTYAPAFAANTTSYTSTVSGTVSSITITPTLKDSLSLVTVNGNPVVNKTASGAIPLSVGDNTISIVVTALDGVTTKTYTLVVTRGTFTPSTNANLANLVTNAGTLSPAFATATTAYQVYVPSTTSSIKITPTQSDANATTTVNGTSVTSGTASAAVTLASGDNIINTVVTAQDGITQKTYKLTVTKLLTFAAYLNNLKTSSGTLSPAFSTTTLNYTESVTNATVSIKVTPVLRDTLSTVTVNGIGVANNTASQAIALAVGSNMITIVVTSIGGVATQTYTIAVTRPSGAVGIVRAGNSTTSFSTDIASAQEPKVHEALSPNGDGWNDFLIIDGITAYPDNVLSVVDRSGRVVFEGKGYDNRSKVFDGHSTTANGKLLYPGTYFYSLTYKAGDETKRKTGYIVLKY